jgi:hypothetical protein
VDVGAPLERLPEVHVARDVGQDPQLDLAVVGCEEHDLRPTGDEGVADPASELRSDGDVLEVGVGRGQPARRCHRLVEGGVQPPGVRVEQQRQRLDICAAQLRVDPPLEDLVDGGVRRTQVLQHRRVGGEARLRAPPARQVELIEEDLLELLRAADGELVTDRFVDLLFQPGDLLTENSRELTECLAINGHADRLHGGQDRDERQLYLCQQLVERSVGCEVLLEPLPGRRNRNGLERGVVQTSQDSVRRELDLQPLRGDAREGLAA